MRLEKVMAWGIPLGNQMPCYWMCLICRNKTIRLSVGGLNGF